MPNQFELKFDGDEENHPIFSDLAPHVVRKFFIYHRENPHLYELFRRFAEQLRASGREYYGVGAIAERIRWHTAVETKGEEFKIGNNHRACYARLLMIRDNSFLGFFRTRRTPGTVVDGEGEIE